MAHQKEFFETFPYFREKYKRRCFLCFRFLGGTRKNLFKPFNSKDRYTDFVLGDDVDIIQNKKENNIYNEEFDPGSG